MVNMTGGHTLHGIKPAALLLPYEVHLSNISLSNKLDLVKAGGANFNISNLDRIGTIGAAESHAQIRSRKSSKNIVRIGMFGLVFGLQSLSRFYEAQCA